MRQYDPEWIFAVLEDLVDFCQHNQMPCTQAALGQALTVAIQECGFMAPTHEGALVRTRAH